MQKDTFVKTEEMTSSDTSVSMFSVLACSSSQPACLHITSAVLQGGCFLFAHESDWRPGADPQGENLTTGVSFGETNCRQRMKIP